jgi:hypothetical protein
MKCEYCSFPIGQEVFRGTGSGVAHDACYWRHESEGLLASNKWLRDDADLWAKWLKRSKDLAKDLYRNNYAGSQEEYFEKDFDRMWEKALSGEK